MEVEVSQSSSDAELVQTLHQTAATAHKYLDNIKQQLHTVYNTAVQHADTTQSTDSIWLDIAELKALNRTVQHTAEQYKQYINSQKLTYDSLELQLITKQYQLQYIQDQLEHTQNYQTQYQHIRDGLQSEAEYVAQHNVDVGTADKHQLYLQRLEDEYKQRQALLSQLNELKQHSATLTATAQSKQKQLDDIDTQCAQLYQQSQHLAQTVLQHDAEYIAADTRAEQLPVPLYTLYSNCNAYRTLTQADGFTYSIQDTGKSVTAPGDANTSATVEQVLQTHNLYLQLQQAVTTKHHILLNVYYHPLLKFVTCHVQVQQTSDNKVLDQYNSFLSNLYANDTGLAPPYNIDAVSTALPYANAKISAYMHSNKAYVWLQQLCAISSVPSNSTQQYTLTETVQRIVNRFATYTALLQQIELIKQSKTIAAAQQHVRASCQTRIGKLAAHANATDGSIQCALAYTHPLDVRNQLTVNIVIDAAYPLTVPQFRLLYKTTEDMQQYVAQLEQNVNTIASLPVDRTQLVQLESSGQFALLAWQIHRVQYLFDRLIAAQHAIASNDNVEQYISSGKDRTLILD